ncbi:uncharacterized protein SPPG_01842 [Spizellomyces punctatus DAOM BR117]|uniref:Raptor N-terminal CASPase-like domain-containing protein n=1 Tax=Spizellomyces punctatus (strain DAOM BR117) TaxID=645134 RepID=A0A0L0HPN5_SPIPD|nr:uncharacterized protein SPPG_01842 [Spizellomyces punctatus DAOM BR117]KND02759.1 hypothetical protein SPPG_01842 [Spizellomyces punctatus DAOM BR117]|eukprot:XP_016610798.1 hypothetical protein SPPG_01842 [Spizellomyces punctatus DAOM BR117]
MAIQPATGDGFSPSRPPSPPSTPEKYSHTEENGHHPQQLPPPPPAPPAAPPEHPNSSAGMYGYYTKHALASVSHLQQQQQQQQQQHNVGNLQSAEDWRMRERLKTVSVALVLCLNISVDPPDIVKPNPCARLECWVDPASQTPRKALEAIGRNLQAQYEVWQPRARYRLSLDPSVDEIKKLCCSLRRNTKEERVLFHYNGHGVPRPTPGVHSRLHL